MLCNPTKPQCEIKFAKYASPTEQHNNGCTRALQHRVSCALDVGASSLHKSSHFSHGGHGNLSMKACKQRRQNILTPSKFFSRLCTSILCFFFDTLPFTLTSLADTAQPPRQDCKCLRHRALDGAVVTGPLAPLARPTRLRLAGVCALRCFRTCCCLCAWVVLSALMHPPNVLPSQEGAE